MLSVAYRIDSALQFGFSISRIGLLVIKLLGFFVGPVINPWTGSKNTSVLMSLGMSLSDLLTHSVWATYKLKRRVYSSIGYTQHPGIYSARKTRDKPLLLVFSFKLTKP